MAEVPLSVNVPEPLLINWPPVFVEPLAPALAVSSIVPLKVDVLLGVAPVTTKVQVNDEKTLVDPTATGSLFCSRPA